MPIRVLVVDDAVVIRKILTDIINADPELEVVGTAPNGIVALKRIRQLKPDIVTLDVEMPEMDGLETLVAIRETDGDLPVIMFSTLSTRGGEVTLEALARGATDYVTKPANVGKAREAFDQVEHELLPRLKAFAPGGQRRRRRDLTPPSSPPRASALAAVDAVVVGSSTGGPVALGTMLCSFERPLPVPVFVVQHMPPHFTLSLAQRLDRGSVSRVVEGSDGEIVEPGTVYIAPGGRHMRVHRVAGIDKIEIHDGPRVNSCRPAVDVLFESSVEVYGARQLGVILTGMGHDGQDGSKLIVDAGGDVFAQDEASSVVWGMPGAVVESGLACRVLPLEEMGGAISQRVGAVLGGVPR